MQIISHEFIVVTDIDGTLIRPGDDNPHMIHITNPYLKETYSYIPHLAHINLIKQYKTRGFFIIAWSANGVNHAKSVIQALNLEKYINLVITKPMKAVDDKNNLNDIIGNRVFIPEEGFNYES